MVKVVKLQLDFLLPLAQQCQAARPQHPEDLALNSRPTRQ